MYAHKATVGITRWGFYEPDMWRPLGALIDSNDTLKPNAVEYLKWKQKQLGKPQELRTNKKGKVSFKAKYGRIEVNIAGFEEVQTCDFITPAVGSNNNLSTPSCTIRLN
jgi:endo-1,4-beta-xylanase